MLQNITEEYKGKWASILQQEGIDPKYFSGRHTPCPMPGCGGTDRSRWIAETETLFCSVCGAKRDITIYMRWTGLSFKESAAKIRNTKINYQKQVVKQKKNPMLLLKRVHSKLKKTVGGDVVDTYLNYRGITKRPRDVLTGTNMPYYGGSGLDGQKVAGVYDCMVSRITDVDGNLESYHLVYLTPLGEKISNAQAKIILPPLNTITGCSSKASNAGKVLAIAEGIETALYVDEDEGVPCWSGISANGMEKIKIPEIVETVYIYADHDKSYTGQAAAYNLAKRLSASGIEVKVFIPETVGTDWLG